MAPRGLLLAFLACACGGDDVAQTGAASTGSITGASTVVTPTSSSSGGDEGPVTTGPGMTGSASAVTATTGVDAGSGGSSSGGRQTFDLGGQPDLGDAGPGCTAIDFLFVIDDSSSMAEHQSELVDNFPTFIAGIEATLMDAESFHVGVTATDPFSGNPGACIKLGALITETTGAGADASDAVCGPYADGLGYMTEDDDLEQTFACAAQVGTAGNGFERPMEAMVTALGPTLAGPGQCNEGFLRDDALLVIVVITDEWDGPGDPEDLGGQRDPPTSTGTPQSWHDDVVAAKLGLAQNVAVLAITHYADARARRSTPVTTAPTSSTGSSCSATTGSSAASAWPTTGRSSATRSTWWRRPAPTSRRRPERSGRGGAVGEEKFAGPVSWRGARSSSPRGQLAREMS